MGFGLIAMCLAGGVEIFRQSTCNIGRILKTHALIDDLI